VPATAASALGRGGSLRGCGSPIGSATISLIHRSWLAYLSDDLPTDSVGSAIGLWRDDDAGAAGVTATLDDGGVVERPEEDRWADVMSASLDHTIWFHRPMRADEWHLHDFTCHGYTGARGLAIGHVFALDGTHVATVAQEVLLRRGRRVP
jgi:acyl-CoA thioesterase-2